MWARSAAGEGCLKPDVKDTNADLVEKCDRNIESYTRPGYKEASETGTDYSIT